MQDDCITINLGLPAVQVVREEEREQDSGVHVGICARRAESG